MSRHRVDYDDELDYDEYEEEEEEELSPEDKAQMKQGTADVRAALSMEASKVTDAQIQEALWHYFYDVDKTVAYLITKFIDPPKKAPPKAVEKPNSEFPPLSNSDLFRRRRTPSSVSWIWRSYRSVTPRPKSTVPR